jgi:rhodanese-related sulfurtransferase
LLLLTIGCLAAALLAAGAVAAEPQAASTARRGTQVTHVAAAAAAELVAEGKVVVLDVRTQREHADGHIGGAKLIDFNGRDFEQRLSALDRDATYLVHCRSGSRSIKALETLKKLGFKSVVHLDGGMNAWSKAGKPVEK